MNGVERVCLELCLKILSSSSAINKKVINYTVKLNQHQGRPAEVILVTKEDEYTFVLDLSEKDTCNENDNKVCHCSKNKYNLRHIQIKGFDAVEFGKTDPQYLKLILEKLAEDHAKCIEENNLENKNYKTTKIEESFFDNLKMILDDVDKVNVDPIFLLEGIKIIEDSYETLLKSDEDHVFINSNTLKYKLFVKGLEEDYRILSIKAEQNFPLVYDLLLTIFSYTDQNMRQYYFHELVAHYYTRLEKNLHKLSLDIAKFLPLITFHRQIHKFIPRVKLETLKQICQVLEKNTKLNGENNSVNLEQFKAIWIAILEINECILYPNLSREDCYKILKNKIGSSDYVFLNYKLIPLQEREGYLGDYFKLKIEVEHGGEVKLFHLFAKYLPTYSDMAIDLAVDSFRKEEFYYLEFVPDLNDLGLGDITNFLPKCYFSRTNDVIIFEDMTMKNYKTVHVSVNYTYDMLLITIKQLAKIHASSLLYEELLSKKTNEIVRLDEKYPEYVEEKTVCKTKETLVKKTFDCAIRTFLNMLSEFPDIPKKFSMDEFKKRGKLAFDLCYEKVKKSDKFRNILCQGDCWASNILFKTDKDNLPIDCCLVDYQLIRYCPPAHDIYFLLYMATTKETRTKFESKLLQEYYWELSNILQRYEVDLKKIYTYQEFLDCCEYMRSQGLCHAIIILQFVLFPAEKLKPIVEDKEQVRRLFYENRDIFIEELKCKGLYRQIMEELAEELYKVCENIYS